MELWAILPELVVAALCLLLVAAAGIARGRWGRAVWGTAVAGLAAAFVLSCRMVGWSDIAVFHGTYAADGLAVCFKLLILTASLLALLLLGAVFGGRPELPHASVATLFVTLGAMALVSSLDLGLIVLFLQMMSMASYVLVGLVRADGRALEALLKYFIYGATALAVMAYGLTFLYGMTGSLDLREIGRSVGRADDAWIGVVLVLVLIGYGFEITMVPFHVWAPDAFSGATAPAGGLISTVPKIAAFGALLRFLLQALSPEAASWPLVVSLLAAASMTLGNLAALRQRRLKRLLAYSSIAQAGYVLMAVAVAACTPMAAPAAAYYLAAYLLMNLGAFGVVAAIERMYGSDERTGVQGLGRTAPWTAATLSIALLSLAGIPPLAGFAGKILLLQAALDAELQWLALVAAANMVVGLYYYVSVMAVMYLRPPASAAPWSTPPRVHPAYAGTFGMTAGLSLVLGVTPAPALGILERAANLVR